MASKFINEYHQTPYYTPPRTHTPFLPPSPLPIKVSPRPAPVIPPVLPTASQNVPFPSFHDPAGLAPRQDVRQRVPSWHAVPAPSDVVQPSYLPTRRHHNRRHSFGNTSYQPPMQQAPVNPYPTLGSTGSYPPTQLNPWLDASSPRNDFFFDLITTTFSPLRLSSSSPGQSTMLSTKGLQEPATHPPLTRMRIVCALIPQWPIDLEYHHDTLSAPSLDSYSANKYPYQQQMPPPPITVADVLITIHQVMHTCVSHVDWARLSRRDEKAIKKAHRKRCGMDDLERAQGVKRVDFLLGATRVMGLVSNGVQDGREVMTLITVDGRSGSSAVGHGVKRVHY